MRTSLDFWGWLTFGCGLLFLACYVVVFVGEWRQAPLGTARWILASSSVGLVLFVLAATFPLQERLSDLLALSGAALLLAAYAARWRTESNAPTDGDTV